jgi:hypothetical protein
MIDRYRLACRPVRDLLVAYLRERQPALDYTTGQPTDDPVHIAATGTTDYTVRCGAGKRAAAGLDRRARAVSSAATRPK